ncbi:MAG TPA: type II secretion system protein GspM [Aestuariivirgaceae bacterium]|jgi:hypothetical protein
MTAEGVFHRILALAVILSLLFGAAGGVYSYALSYRARSDQILEHRRTLGRLEALVARSGDVDRLSETFHADQTPKLLHNAPTVPLLVALLRRQLQAKVTGHRAQFIGASEIPAREEHGITFVGLKLEISGSIDSLANVLTSLETAVPLLFIEKATIVANPMNLERADRMPLLALRVEVVAASQLNATSIDSIKAE